MPVRQFWVSRRALMFSLSLSESLKGAYRTAVLRYRNLLISAVATPVAFAGAPLVGVFVLFLYIEIYIVFFAITGIQELLPKAFVAENMRKMDTRLRRIVRKYSMGLSVDGSLQLLRMLWGASLIFVGAGVVTATNFFPSSDKIILNTLFWWYQDLTWTPALAMMLLGVMVLDWLIVRTMLQDLLLQFKRLRFGKLPLVVSVSLIGISVAYAWTVGVNWFIGMVKQLGLEWLFQLFALITGILVAVGIFWKTGRGIYHQIRDRRTFKRIVVTNRMPRQDITAAFNSLLTNRWRLAFVRQLAQQKIMATGNWPAGFQLSVAADSALTELAKLEERWLKLDR
jgi:hypothetical protein